VFPVRYGLNSYILFRINSVFKGLSKVLTVKITVFRDVRSFSMIKRHFSTLKMEAAGSSKMLVMI
jgi:hypothetical protein